MNQPTNSRTLFRQATVVCGQCGGSGEVPTVEHLGHGRTNESTQLCNLCQGGGMLTIKKSITIETYPKHAKKANQ